MYDDDNGDSGPKGTFEIYKAEADSLYKQGEYRKAIEGYTTALELQPGEKNCLVSRSKCYLQLGDTKNALIDAESSLKEDATYHKGLYQKAEALYYKGDFEMSLVFYHRGNRLRPEIQEFKLGIQKAQEAIDNAVGCPDQVKLTTEGDLTFFQEMSGKQKKKPAYRSYQKSVAQEVKPKRELKRTAKGEKSIKQLLGELYGDKQYLEKLLKETDSNTASGQAICDLVEEGLQYLDTRTDFWRQQRPMYARKHERIKKRSDEAHFKGSPNDYVMRELELIDEAHINGRYERSLKRGRKLLAVVEKYADTVIVSRMGVLASIHSCLGNAHLELGAVHHALQHHQKDVQIGEKHCIEDAVSRGLDNLGRVYARSGHFAKAIEIWERKLPLSKSSLESTWLHHEIGRCYLELGEFVHAKDYGHLSLLAAGHAQDDTWKLQASVLIAQAELHLDNLSAALDFFIKSLEHARVEGDKSANGAITKAIEEVHKRMATSVKLDDADS